jgi:hypothetical protein
MIWVATYNSPFDSGCSLPLAFQPMIQHIGAKCKTNLRKHYNLVYGILFGLQLVFQVAS